ncbi:hypothetical protein [Sphingomonas sp. Leaf412]|nr:hypothetical protein [Sphingomonas sp. Leaf412]
MPEEQPNKPAGGADANGTPPKVEDDQAVRNQGEVSPEDYPLKASGKDQG